MPQSLAVKRRERSRRRHGSLGIGEKNWKKLRAAVLSALIVWNVIGAYPTPGDVTEEKLSQGVAKKELDRWVSRLRGFGFDTDAQRLGRFYAGLANSVNAVRNFVMSPVQPFMDLTGTQQGWRLFAMPNERPHVLRVTGERRGKRRVLYETWSPSRTFLAETLEFRRVRALYNPSSSGPPNTYDAFARRLSERAFELKPELDTVTVLLEQRHTTLPGEPEDRKREERFVHVFPRDPP
jgi:hypothetical protein